MQKNIGPLDRTVRILIGSVMIVAGFVFQAWWWLIGVIPLLTGILRFCPLYVPMGFRTEGRYIFTVGYSEEAVKPAKK